MISLHYISFNHSERLSNPIFNNFSTWNEAKEDIYGTKYSRMDQVKIVEDSLLKI